MKISNKETESEFELEVDNVRLKGFNVSSYKYRFKFATS